MRILLFALLGGLLLGGCESDPGRRPELVCDVTMPPATRFAPGDSVIVRARGLEPDDGIMFDIRWPLRDELFDEGYARGVHGVVVGRSDGSVTFLAPGGYPASTVGVLLRRGGRYQRLGEISVSDGLPPAEFGLYGVMGTASGERGLCRIDRQTGDETPLYRFASGEEPQCMVNAAGTNAICGLVSAADGGCGFCYDLTMRYRSAVGSESCVATGQIASTVCFLAHRDDCLYLVPVSQTRDASPFWWQLPEGVSAERLVRRPFAMTAEGFLLLSVNRGDGMFAPLLLASPFSSSIGRSRVCDPVRAAALLPFAVVLPGEDPERMALTGGYVVSGADGGDSELRLYDPVTATFTATLAMLPERVRSVAFEHGPKGTLLYLLTGDGIRIYDLGADAWQRLDAGRECTEIVLAR